MFDCYLKQLVADGGGKFSVVKISAETDEALQVKRSVYLADDFQEATEEEYRAQFAERTAPVEGAADKALGENPNGEQVNEEAKPEGEQVSPSPEENAGVDKES